MTDVTTLLQELIRVDTTNPPGNEEACVAHVESLLRAHGIETERYEPSLSLAFAIAALFKRPIEDIFRTRAG